MGDLKDVTITTGEGEVLSVNEYQKKKFASDLPGVIHSEVKRRKSPIISKLGLHVPEKESTSFPGQVTGFERSIAKICVFFSSRNLSPFDLRSITLLINVGDWEQFSLQEIRSKVSLALLKLEKVGLLEVYRDGDVKLYRLSLGKKFDEVDIALCGLSLDTFEANYLKKKLGSRDLNEEEKVSLLSLEQKLKAIEEKHNPRNKWYRPHIMFRVGDEKEGRDERSKRMSGAPKPKTGDYAGVSINQAFVIWSRKNLNKATTPKEIAKDIGCSVSPIFLICRALIALSEVKDSPCFHKFIKRENPDKPKSFQYIVKGVFSPIDLEKSIAIYKRDYQGKGKIGPPEKGKPLPAPLKPTEGDFPDRTKEEIEQVFDMSIPQGVDIFTESSSIFFYTQLMGYMKKVDKDWIRSNNEKKTKIRSLVKDLKSYLGDDPEKTLNILKMLAETLGVILS